MNACRVADVPNGRTLCDWSRELDAVIRTSHMAAWSAYQNLAAAGALEGRYLPFVEVILTEGDSALVTGDSSRVAFALGHGLDARDFWVLLKQCIEADFDGTELHITLRCAAEANIEVVLDARRSQGWLCVRSQQGSCF